MRLLAEIISSEVETRNITNKRTGEEKPTKIFVIHAVDGDFPTIMYKISVWENFMTIYNQCQKGAVIEVRFRNIRPANEYEKLDQISATEENIRLKKSAGDALKEMQLLLSKQDGPSTGNTKPMSTAQ